MSVKTKQKKKEKKIKICSKNIKAFRVETILKVSFPFLKILNL